MGMMNTLEKRRSEAARPSAQRQRDLVAMVVLFGLITIMSALAANVSAGGTVGITDRSIGIAKYLRDGSIPLIFLYVAVYYPSEIIKYFYIPFILMSFTIVFRSEYFTLVGVVAIFRVILVISAFILMYKALEEQGERALNALVLIGFAYVLITFPYAIAQVLWGQNQFGTTFFGSRALGFTENPGTLAQTLAFISLLVVLKERKSTRDFVLIGLCVFLSMLTGGRGGQLSLIMTVAAMLFVNRTKVTFTSFSYLLIGFITMPLVFSAFLSARGVSGRSGTEDAESFDGRLDVWVSHVQNYLNEPTSFLFGFAPGMGINGLRSLYINGAVQLNFEPVVSADGFFMAWLLSFGVVGAVILIAIIAYFIMKISYFNRVLCLTAISPIVISSTPFELYPVNVFLMACLAVMWWRRPVTVPSRVHLQGLPHRQGFGAHRSARDRVSPL